jgi:tRNA threonylcarbamoyl adenosine modification protein YeaZ
MYLAIQSTYHNLELGLFKKNDPIEIVSLSKVDASKFLIPTLQNLLEKHALSLHDIEFICANTGPAPFTTLRVVIASINGLSFARHIPLIGVDAFHAYAKNIATSPFIIIFNAFGNDVYYAIKEKDTLQIGVAPIVALLQKIKKMNFDTLSFFGNGTQMHADLITNELGTKAHISHSTEYASIESIAALGYAQWLQKTDISYQLMPLYLKNHPASAT